MAEKFLTKFKQHITDRKTIWLCLGLGFVEGKNKARKDDEVEFLTFPFPLKTPSKTCTDFRVTWKQLYMYTQYSIL